MLVYLGRGERHYDSAPVSLISRPFWEFQAVLRGAIGLDLPGGRDVLRRRHLWVFPPGHRHGWVGEKGRAAEIVVFHFRSVPQPVQRLVQPVSMRQIPLSKKMCQRLRDLGEEASRYYHRPALGMAICYEHILMELSLLVCESSSQSVEQEDEAKRRVDAALLWFSTRLEHNPDVDQVARAVGVSSSHLRRMFHEVLQTSPKEAIDHLRFQHAKELMTDARIKLEAVSEACGFGSASAFSRAFKLKFRCSPETWRLYTKSPAKQ